MAGLEAQKRPLMLAALNGLSVARGSGREESRVDAARVPMDERVSAGLVKHVTHSLGSLDSSTLSLFRHASTKVSLTDSLFTLKVSETWSVLHKIDPFQHLMGFWSGWVNDTT